MGVILPWAVTTQQARTSKSLSSRIGVAMADLSLPRVREHLPLSIVLLAIAWGCNSEEVAMQPKPLSSNLKVERLTELPSSGGLSDKVISAKDVLIRELNRRFTDENAIEFGISRIEGPHHESLPTRSATRRIVPNRSRMDGSGNEEYLIDGKWIPSNELRPTMTPENADERQAVRQIIDSRTEAAIYTVGGFESDDGSAIKPKRTAYSWGNGRLHGRGPVYLTPQGRAGPKVFELIEFARKAWKSGRKVSESKSDRGWHLIATRVEAPSMTCAKCHGDKERVIDGVKKKVKGAVQRPGDGVGVFILALKSTR